MSPSAETITRCSARPDHRARAVRVLIVDDETQMRESLMPFLRRRGFDVMEADNGAQALKVLENFKAEIIISDIRMPVLDGIGLLKTVRVEQPDVDVILVTGHADTENAVEAARLRANDFIRKPYDLADLLAVIRRVLRERQLRNELVTKSLALAEAQRMAALGILAAGIMHEINNPNTFIHGNALLLRDHLLPALHHPDLRPSLERLTRLSPEEFQTAIGDIQRGSERITAIVDRAVDGLRLSQTSRTSEVNSVVDKALALVRPLSAPGVNVARRTVEDSCVVMGSEEEVLQIFVNLLQNAIESFNDSVPGRIVVNIAAPSAGTVAISIEDDGPGIPDNFRDRIFLPFASRKSDRPGRGLGCFIAWQMTRNLGGTLRFEPVSPNGSRFVVVLPMAHSGPVDPSDGVEP